MTTTFNLNEIYTGIGEFTVLFQMLEQNFRENGWLLEDPLKKTWPPTTLRNLRNEQLLDRVADLYDSVVGAFPGPAAAEYCRSFRHVVDAAHEVRRGRNELLHSVFVSLDAGDDCYGLLRTNSRTARGPSGEATIRMEEVTTSSLTALRSKLASVFLGLNLHQTQLIHWAPFDPPPRLQTCGLAFHLTGLDSLLSQLARAQ